MNLQKTMLAGAVALATALSMTTSSFAAEPIVGNWTTASGETAAIAKCGGSYCVTLKTGKYSGKSIGRMSGSGSKYKGKITDPANDKTYSGSASVAGASLKMTGCALKVFCKTQRWKRQ